MTIDYVVKKKAIDLHLQGRGRNEICRILNSQKMRISEATITHLIQDWKRQHQDSNSESSSQLNESGQVQYQTSVSSIPRKEQQQEDKTQETITISPKTPQCTAINIGMRTTISNGSQHSIVSSPHYGDWPPDLDKPAPDSKNSGAPLSFFLNKVSTATITTAVVTNKKEEDVVSDINNGSGSDPNPSKLRPVVTHQQPLSATSSDPQRLIKATNQIAQVSDLSLPELEERIKAGQAELSTIQYEIEKLKREEQEACQLVATINKDKDSFLELKEEMGKAGIEPTDSPRFLNVIHAFKNEKNK
jgi:hypothetical protein